MPSRRTPHACFACTLLSPVLIGGLAGFLIGAVALVVLAISLAREDRLLEEQVRDRLARRDGWDD